MRHHGRRGPSNFAVGLALLVLAAIAGVLAQTKEVPFRHHTEFDVAFRSVSGLTRGTQVRMAGVTIGKVVGTRSLPDDAAIARIRIEDRGLPIHRDARFTIRPRLFLEGNFFIDVRAGSPSAPLLRNGAVVPVTQTATPVQFDQVLTALQSDTRRDLQDTLDELGRGLHRGADAVNRTYRYTGTAYREGARVAEAQLGTRDGELGDLVRDSGLVASAFDRDPQALQSLIVGFARTARGFARRDDALDATLTELPRTLRAGLPAFASLDRAFPSIRRLARELRPALKTSVPALDASLPLVRELRGLVGPAELRGLVRDLRRTTPDAVRFSTTSVPLGETTRQAASCLNSVLVPWSQGTIQDPVFPAKVQIFEEATRALVGLSGESRSGDANGQWFRTLLTAGNATYSLGQGKLLTTAAPIAGVNPVAPAQRPPLRADVPCETQDQPDMRSNPGPAPRRIPTSQTTPAAIARTADAQQVAVDWLAASLPQLAGSSGLKVAGASIAARRGGRP